MGHPSDFLRPLLRHRSRRDATVFALPKPRWFTSAITPEVNHLGKRKLLFDQGRPVGGAGREHGVVEVELRMMQHRVQFA